MGRVETEWLSLEDTHGKCWLMSRREGVALAKPTGASRTGTSESGELLQTCAPSQSPKSSSKANSQGCLLFLESLYFHRGAYYSWRRAATLFPVPNKKSPPKPTICYFTGLFNIPGKSTGASVILDRKSYNRVLPPNLKMSPLATQGDVYYYCKIRIFTGVFIIIPGMSTGASIILNRESCSPVLPLNMQNPFLKLSVY